MRLLLATLLAFVITAPAAPVISEFMAANETTLKDGHDNYEDWIEIWNPDATPVDLAGWRLTDTTANTSKFVFPTKVVPAGGRIIVFASNRAGSTGAATHVDVLGYLHTNFSLGKNGEYLALVSPAGVVGTEFAPTFPVQVDDISFGPPATVEAFTGSTSALRYKVPVTTADDTAMPNWTQANFTDTSWTSTTGSGVGFEVGSPTAAWLLDEAAGATSAVDFTGGGRNAALNGTGQTFGVSGANAGTATAAQFSGAGGLTVPFTAALNPAATFTFAAWVYPTSNNGTHQALVSSRVGPAGLQRGFILYMEPNGAGAHRWSYWTGTLGSWDELDGPNVTYNAWTHVAITRAANGTKRLYINGAQVAVSAANAANYVANNNAANGFHLGCGDDLGTNFRYVGKIDDAGFWSSDIGVSLIGQHMSGGVDTFPTPLYPAHFQSNVQSAMYSVNPGIYTRHNFTVADKSRYSSLRLRAKYDDGFVAYLNGVEIARRNFAGTRAFNSVASGDRLENDAVIFEDVDVTAAALPAMVNGANSLAVHGMNYSGVATDFLLTPVFDATLTPAAQAPGYFAVATPGTANSGSNVNPGPEIKNVSHTPTQPVAGGAVTVTAHVTPRLGPIAGASLKYRVMYGAESAAIAMADVGPVPGATDGSRIFTGTIPGTHGAAARQMLRYYLTATDTSARTWREPFPVDLTNDDGVSQSPEFFGTVVADAALTSTMPIMQWFTNDVANSDTRVGSRASVFYGGLFYDNIYVRQRGGYTSSGSQKFNFNAKNGVFVNAALGTVGELNMNSSGADANQFRVSSAYAIYRAAGHPALESFPVAMVRNGTVHRIAQLIEQLDEDFLKRQGFDNDGALYKFVQRLGEENTPGNVVGGDYSGSPGFKFESPIYGVEKKTRLHESFTDFSDFTAGIVPANPLASRSAFVFKNVNVPNFVNFMAVRALISEEDVNRKNFYAFRDSDDSLEWYLFPWDKDMTLGVAYDTNVAANRNNPWQSTSTFKHDPFGTKQWCVLWQNGYDVPEIRAMVGRRLRTLMDTMMGAPGTAIPGTTVLEQNVDAIRATMLTPPPGYTADGNYRNRASFDSWLANHRTALFTTYGPSSGYGMIPNAAATINVSILSADANPATGTQDHEHLVIVNNAADTVDITGWTLSGGGINHTFKPGTAIVGTSTSATMNRAHVANNRAAFRTRPGAPTTAEFVLGNYDGALTARGGTVLLKNAAGTTVSTFTLPVAPTAGQQQLRITELMVAPVPPTLAELTVMPTLEAEDFEFIELQNIGATPLTLTNYRITDGVDFTFAAATLAPGQRILVCDNTAAFDLRYGAGKNRVGNWLGALNNGGERIRIVDNVGEEILDFTYDPRWFPPATDDTGHSIVVSDDPQFHEQYLYPTMFALSAAPGGTPAAADTNYANTFDTWRWQHLAENPIYLPPPPNPANTVNTAFSGLLADPDADLQNNFTEYAFGRNPLIADNTALTTASLVNVAGTDHLAITFQRPPNALDTTYTIETASSLAGPWTADGILVSTGFISPTIEQATYRDPVPRGTAPRFIRVRATRP